MVALPKALERGRAWGCPSSPVSLHPAHVRSRVQPGICSWQSQHGPGCWQGASSRHPPWCWIHPWVHQEEQRGSLLCFDSLKIPNPAVLLPTRGVLAAPSTPGIPQPHQQPGREVAAPKKWHLSIWSREKSSTRTLQKWPNPTMMREQRGQKDTLGCVTTLVRSRAQETAETREKSLKKTKKITFFHLPSPALPKQQGLSASQDFGGLWKFSASAGSRLPKPGIGHPTPPG